MMEKFFDMVNSIANNKICQKEEHENSRRYASEDEEGTSSSSWPASEAEYSGDACVNNVKGTGDKPLELLSIKYVFTPTDSINKDNREETKEPYERGHWKNRMEFLLALLGYSVGLGNLWRFPYLAYENGGAAFLIPYLIVVVIVGRPLYMSEVSLGQYTQLGPLHTWKRCVPAMSGLGVTLCVAAIVVSAVYKIILAYTIYFIYAIIASIGSPVPWSWCNPIWAGNNCYAVGYEVPCAQYNLSGPTKEINCSVATIGSGTLYWRNAIVGIDPEGLTKFGDLGEIHWHLVISMFVVWITICLSTIKGVKSVGKVVYFTATFPFIVMFILVIAGLTLPGASIGMKYLFIPKWEKLLEIKVWRVATEQVIFSMGVGGAGLVTMGSYNKFSNKVHIDIVILSVLDLVASLMCAITIFSVLGAMAYEQGLDDVSKVVSSGTGLAFITYPQAISRTMAVPHLWSLLFFLMVLTLGLDTAFAGMETIATTITDTFPILRKYKHWVIIAWCTIFFTVGIAFCTSKAQYLFYLFDVYGAGLGSLLSCTLKVITLHWIYGVNRFAKDLKFMLGYGPSIFLKFCWAVASPVTLLSLFIGSVLMWRNPTYGGQVSYPTWAMILGWTFAFFPISFTPILFTFELIKAAIKRNILAAFRPSPLWAPGCPIARQRLKEHSVILALKDNCST